MRNLMIAIFLLSWPLVTEQLSARSSVSLGKQTLEKYRGMRKFITTAGGKSLASAALVFSMAALPLVSTPAQAPEGAPAWMQEEVAPNMDYDWQKQVFYLLVDKGDDKLLFHVAYLGTKDGDALFVGRHRPYGTHLIDSHTEGMFTTLVGYRGEIASGVELEEVTTFYDSLDGLLNLTIIAIKDVDMGEYQHVSLAAFPYQHEEALRAFTYRDTAHPLLKSEEQGKQFMFRLLTRECMSSPHAGSQKVRLGLHTCGTTDFAIGGLVFLQTTGELVGYHSGWVDEDGLGLALGMPENLIMFADWAAAAPALQRPMTTTTTWGELKKSP